MTHKHQQNYEIQQDRFSKCKHKKVGYYNKKASKSKLELRIQIIYREWKNIGRLIITENINI